MQMIYQRIEKDKRHFNVQLMHTAVANDRIFPKWAMAYLSLQETASDENVEKIKQSLVLLAEDSPVLEIELHQFWNQVYEVLREVGYYPDTREKQ